MILSTIYRLAGKLPSPIKKVITRFREQSFFIGVIGIVLDDENRLMLFRHTYRPFAPWGLPSGWLKRGESLEQSIIREINEETGLSVVFDRVLHIEAYPKEPKIDVWMKYRALPGVARKSAEVEEVKFFSLDSLPPLLARQENFLRDYQKQIQK